MSQEIKGTLSSSGNLVGHLDVGGGGTDNYPDLYNLPQINGVTLIGNKTTEDIGIDIPAKVSELQNDSGFITSDDLPTKVSDLENDSGFITSDALPTKTSDLRNDSGFVTSSDIPTKVSELENDSNYATRSELPTNTSDLYNDSGFITSSALPTHTSDLQNDSGYVTIADVIDDTQSDDDTTYSSDKVEALIDSLLPIDTSSGAIANFSTDLVKPLVSLKAEIVATQASGTPTPSTPIPISGWSDVSLARCGANLCNQADIVGAYPTKYTVDTDGSIKTVGNLGLSDVLWTNKSKVSGVLNVIFVSKYQNTGSVGIRPKILYTDGTNSVIYTTNTQDYSTKTLLTTSSKTVDKIVVDYGTNNPTNFYLEVTLDTTVTDYEQYTGNTKAINLGDTIYGGVLDVKNGVLRVTHKVIADWNDVSITYSSTYGFLFTISELKTGVANITNILKCSHYMNAGTAGFGYITNGKIGTNSSSGLNTDRICINDSNYSDASMFKSFLINSNVQLVYELANPITITGLTPAEIVTIIGTNNIFADSGNVEVKYKESIQKYIDDKIAETQALIL